LLYSHMLRIRREQYEVFKPVAEEVFLAEVIDYLKREYGDREVRLPESTTPIDAIPVEKLRAMVENGISRARSYGIQGKSSLLSFVVIMFLTAPNFDQHPLIKHILDSSDITAESRIEELWQRTVDQNWIVVRESYDPNFWLPAERESSDVG
jgi:hypothetical protein